VEIPYPLENQAFMKPTLFAVLFTLITSISLSANAQRTYTPITTSFSSSLYPSGTICNSCELVLSPGVTITINSTCACTNCTFVGGTVIIASGSNFTLSGVDSFVNENVQMNNSFPIPSSGVTFYGDTVAFNTAMSLTGGRTDLDSSRVSVNAALTLDEGTIYKDSLHLNNNLTFNYSTDSIAYSHIDVANGVTITAATSNVINSTFGFAGNSSMNFDYGMNSTGSNYYLGGTSAINVPNAATLSGDNVSLIGTTNSFTVGNGLTTTNTNFNLAGTTGNLTAQSLTMTGGSITAATGSTISSTYAIGLTNTTTTLTGTTFGGSQLTTSGGSFAATNSPVSSTYAVSFTNTPASFSNSTFTGSQLSTTGSTLTLTNDNATFTYAASMTGTNVSMNGNSAFTASSLSSAHVNLTYSASEDATSTLAIANNNNYLQSSATGSVSCGGAAPQHACTTGYIFGCATIKHSTAPVGCTVLALASINLSAAVAGPGQVALTWTDNETGTAADHYSIQRNTGNNEWSDIGAVAAGSTTDDYFFTDANAPAGNTDYRIQRTDADGNIGYSAVASITLALANSPLSIYPNPAIGGRFYINTPYTGEMVVNVYTSTGQLLLHTSLQGQTQYSIQLPAQNLSLSAVVVQTISQKGTGAFTVLVR
jgi:hypothetical protein